MFGVPGGIDASPEALTSMLRPLPPETFWTVTCVGRHHPRMLALGLLYGASCIRTGLEDAVYISRGVLAPSNAAFGQHRDRARPRRRSRGNDAANAVAARARAVGMSSLIEALGAKRVLEPPGALPQAAVRLDATLPIQPFEIEIEVDMLCLELDQLSPARRVE